MSDLFIVISNTNAYLSGPPREYGRSYEKILLYRDKEYFR